MTVSTIRSTAGEPSSVSTTAGLLLRRERLRDLAVVAVDRHRLDPELPRVHVELLDVLDRGLFRHVHGLGDRAAEERLHRAHHLDVTHVVDRVVAHRAREHRQVLGVEAGCTDDRLLLVDVVDDLRELLLGVAELAQRTRDRLVDDLHRPATDELLRLREREVGLDPGGVAVHHQADRPGRREHGGLGVAHAVDLAHVDGLVPRLLRGAQELRRHQLLVDVRRLGAVHAQHVEHRLGVLGVARGTGPYGRRCALVAYAWPVISAVIDAAQARPPSES